MNHSYFLLILIILFSISSFGQKPNALDVKSDKYHEVGTEATPNSRLKIRVGLETKNINKQILFTVDKRATDKYDKGFDAQPFALLKNDIYWVCEEKKLVIQAVGELLKDRVLPIGIVTKNATALKIKIDTVENPYPNMEVYLRDNLTMDTYDILNENFEISLEEGEYNDKYSIVFEPKPQIEQEEELEELVEEEMSLEIDNNIAVMEVYVSGINSGQLTIKRPEEMELTDISIFNVLGQQIKVWNSNLAQREMELSFHSNKGVHLVVMNTNKGRISKKVIVN